MVDINDDTTRRVDQVADTAQSDEDDPLSRDEWRKVPHRYAYRHPHYPCDRCGLFPGHHIHTGETS